MNYFRYIIWWKPTTEYRIILDNKLKQYEDDPNAIIIAGPYYSKAEAIKEIGTNTGMLNKIRNEKL